MRVRCIPFRIQGYVFLPSSIAARRHVHHVLQTIVLAVMLQCDYATIKSTSFLPSSIAARQHVHHILRTAALAAMLQCNYIIIQSLVLAWSMSRVRQQALSTKYLAQRHRTLKQKRNGDFLEQVLLPCVG